MTDATPQPAAPLSAAEDKQWAGLSHLLGILGWLPPLIIFLIFKDRGPKTNTESKSALNFQLTLLIAHIVGWITYAFIIGILIDLAAWVVGIIFSILGFTKVNAGQDPYKYPFAIPFIK